MGDIKNNTFHITITKNETGEVLVDENTVAIIGAIDAGDKSTRSMSFTRCNHIDLAYTAHVALKCAEETVVQAFAELLAKACEARDLIPETEE